MRSAPQCWPGSPQKLKSWQTLQISAAKVGAKVAENNKMRTTWPQPGYCLWQGDLIFSEEMRFSGNITRGQSDVRCPQFQSARRICCDSINISSILLQQ